MGKSAVNLINVIFELHPHAFQPLDGIVGVVSHGFDKLRISSEVAACQSLLCMKLRTVFNLLAALSDRMDRVETTAGNRGVAAHKRHLFQNNNVLDTVLSC